MIWYIVCIVIGAFVGLIVAAILGAAANKGQEEHDLIDTWYDGYEAGKRLTQGKELMSMSRKVMQ